MQHTDRPDYVYQYHWGRILFVVVLVITAIGLGSYFAFTKEDAPTQPATQPLASKTSEKPVPAAPPVKKAEAPTRIESPIAQAEEPAISPKEIQPKEPSAQKTTAEPKPQPLQVVSKPVTKTDVKTDLKTRAKLFTDTIKRAKLTTQVKRHEPGEALPVELTMAENGLSKVYFYTEVIGEAGNTHYHHWYKDGNLVAKVPIAIGSDRWRCYSSKYLNHNHAGDWQVKVKNKKGELLAESQFRFLTPKD